jgi:alkaline phosphatase D
MLVIAVVILTATVIQDQFSTKDLWAPLPTSETTLTSIFFGSCSSQKVEQPFWHTMSKLEPDLVVLMGDNVYADCNDKDCTNLQEAYDEWAAHSSFQGARSVLPITAVLDDHDYGQGDCHADNPYKDVAKQMFIDFFDLPEERRHENDGLYGVYEWGSLGQRIQLVLLDTRYARSPFLDTDEPGAPGKESYIPDTENRDKQMLSPEQWKWLEEQVNRPTDVRLVVSSIQVLAEGNGFEGWRMLPYERDRLTDLLQSQTFATTIILSGDRHKGGFYRYQNLTEVTSSSFTHTIPFGAYSNCTNAKECDEEDERRIGDFVRVNHFGSIGFDWSNRTMTVALRRTDTSQHSMYFDNRGHLTGDAGDPVQSHTYPLHKLNKI